MSGFVAVVLAAGYGSRLQSETAKVLHEVNGVPMIHWVVRSVLDAGAKRVVLVVGHKGQDVKQAMHGWDVEFVTQFPPRGTGDAMKATEPLLAQESDPIVVLCGDVPLLSAKTIRNLVDHHRASHIAATILTAELEERSGYGRILHRDGHFEGIIEERDCTAEQKEIRCVNAGTYCFEGDQLWQHLHELQPNNAAGEFYLTDVPSMLLAQGEQVAILDTEQPFEIQSVNRPQDLVLVNQYVQETGLNIFELIC